jgi:hypothetical protein
MDRIENDGFNSSYIVACLFVAAVTLLPSRCLAMIGGCTYIHTGRWEGFMNYAFEVGFAAVIYIPTLIQSV